MAYPAFNPTNLTWSQQANEQAYKAMNYGNLNSTSLPQNYDPIYNKLIQEIGNTVYRELRVMQRWADIGYTAAPDSYPRILREIYMKQRKGWNYPMDNETRPNTLNWYNIYQDEIDVRYHSTQFRWMYEWTLFDEELRRFAGQSTIARLAEMKMINCTNARNMFMDTFRKKLLEQLIENAAVQITAPVDITADNLTQAQAIEWLEFVDNMLYEMEEGSSQYNKMGQYMQIPRGRMQFIMTRALYKKVMTTAFPNTFTETSYFKALVPGNVKLVPTFGTEGIAQADATTTALEPTFDAKGMNLLNWDGTDYLYVNTNPKLQCVIMDKGAIGVEDNLNETLFGPKDITKLATPVASHFWTSGYITDLLPSVVLEGE